MRPARLRSTWQGSLWRVVTSGCHSVASPAYFRLADVPAGRRGDDVGLLGPDQGALPPLDDHDTHALAHRWADGAGLQYGRARLGLDLLRPAGPAGAAAGQAGAADRRTAQPVAGTGPADAG